MTETYTPDRLIAGDDMPRVTESAVIAAGQNLQRGALLGRVTATGKLKLVDSTATDGSETVYAVLAEDVDSTSEDKISVVYLTGEFNEAALSVGGTDTVSQHKAAARAMGIFFRTAVSA